MVATITNSEQITHDDESASLARPRELTCNQISFYVHACCMHAIMPYYRICSSTSVVRWRHPLCSPPPPAPVPARKALAVRCAVRSRRSAAATASPDEVGVTTCTYWSKVGGTLIPHLGGALRLDVAQGSLGCGPALGLQRSRPGRCGAAIVEAKARPYSSLRHARRI